MSVPEFTPGCAALLWSISPLRLICRLRRIALLCGRCMIRSKSMQDFASKRTVLIPQRATSRDEGLSIISLCSIDGQSLRNRKCSDSGKDYPLHFFGILEAKH